MFNGKTHYDQGIFNSNVKLPEGIYYVILYIEDNATVKMCVLTAHSVRYIAVRRDSFRVSSSIHHVLIGMRSLVDLKYLPCSILLF